MRIAVVSGIVVERDAISAAACAQATTLESIFGPGTVDLFTSHLARETSVPAHVVADPWALLQHPRFQECDVVIFHWGIVTPLFDAVWLIDLDRQDVVVHFHNVTPRELASPDQLEVLEASSRQLQVVTSLRLHIWTYSQHNRDTLESIGVDGSAIADVPFPIEAPAWFRRPRRTGAATRLLCIGRLVPAKGTAALVRALGVLSERGRVDISLTIASNETLSAGSYAEHVRQLVSDLALEDRVSFVSPTDDELWELLAATDVVVSPSHHEGLCVPIIEGYIAGARAIGTEAGNLPFIVQPPDPVVPVDDPEALADAIEAVSDAGAAGEEWHSAIDSVVRRFSRAYTARRLFDEIRHLAPEAANVTSTASTPRDQIRPWIDVQPDAVLRHRTRTSLNRMPDYSDWEPGSRFTDLLRELRQPVTIHRKSWEYGLCLLGLEQLGALRPDASAIAVGAGSEPPLFHLANIIGRMVATDLYDNPDHEGNPAMLDNPAAFAPFEYRRDRLEVYRMSGDQLAFEENTFDIAFSLSSIEHFGSRATQRAAFDEMIRVVKPGGIICIMTELILTGHTHGEYFQWDEMSEIFLEHPGVTLVGGDVDLAISQSLIDNPVDPRDARTQNRSPHIVLDLDGMKWTSLSMFFSKL